MVQGSSADVSALFSSVRAARARVMMSVRLLLSGPRNSSGRDAVAMAEEAAEAAEQRRMVP